MLKETKYAINSTVGTPYFKSLSELFKPKEVRFSLIGIVQNYITTSPILYCFPGSFTIFNKKFKSFGNGTIEISCFAESSTNPQSIFKIFKNGQLIVEKTNSYANVSRLEITYGDEIQIDATDARLFRIGANQEFVYDNIIEKSL